ncbi:MAG: hypothetical protein A2Y40_09275 [Candidatus Margulisbacteria bacterium GWF2_35_9]|nr:MAG: hypothetical protein A2Y40_09275 [Candidatus Margulisbacteria bacterium GWF2_35_9]
MINNKFIKQLYYSINKYIFNTQIKVSSIIYKKSISQKKEISNPISVCIPCYDMYGKGALYLTQLLDSLCIQTFKQFEVVISDQSKKSDSIKQCADKYMTKLNIKYIQHKGSSSSTNMNHAIKHSSYDLIKPLFQDDFFVNPNALYEISLCQSGWGMASFVHTDKDNSHYYKKMTPRWNDKIIKGINTIGCPSVIYFYKNNETFFDEKLEWLMDCEFYFLLKHLYGLPNRQKTIHACIRLWDNSVSYHVSENTKINENDYLGNKYKVKPVLFGVSLGNNFSSYTKHVSISVDTLEFDKSADYKVFLQVEPPEILTNISKVIKNKSKFDLILAWDKDILANCDNAILFPFGTSWITDFNVDIKCKKTAVSFLMSSKKNTTGHKLRHDIFNKIPDRIGNMDIVKHMSPPRIPDKADILKPYQYSVIIENVNSINWFSEKLIDCLMTKTIPIYFGCPNLNDFFNMDGILTFSSYEELSTILPTLSSELYFKKIKAIEENFCKASEYVNIWERVDKIIMEKLG